MDSKKLKNTEEKVD